MRKYAFLLKLKQKSHTLYRHKKETQSYYLHNNMLILFFLAQKLAPCVKPIAIMECKVYN